MSQHTKVKIDYSIFHTRTLFGTTYGIGKLSKFYVSPTQQIQGYIVVIIHEDQSHTILGTQLGTEAIALHVILDHLQRQSKNHDLNNIPTGWVDGILANTSSHNSIQKRHGTKR